METLTAVRAQCEALNITPNAAQEFGVKLNQDGMRRNALELLPRPDVAREKLVEIWPELANVDGKILDQLSNDSLYAGYIDRQTGDIAAMRRDTLRVIPDHFDYSNIGGLSTELQSKLNAVRPQTLDHAQKIDGMTPAALTLILARLRHGETKASA